MSFVTPRLHCASDNAIKFRDTEVRRSHELRGVSSDLPDRLRISSGLARSRLGVPWDGPDWAVNVIRKETATVNLACRQLSQRALTAVSHGPRWLSGLKLARADSNWLLLALALARAGSPYTQNHCLGAARFTVAVSKRCP